jgi:uncharacterized membrane protein YfcA
VVADVHELGDADDTARVALAAPADARDERVAGREPAQFRLRFRRYMCILRPRHDRREHTVDVEQDRGAPRVVDQSLQRIHAAYDTAVRLVVIGLVAGFLSALLGVGGGVVIVPLLLLVGSWDARSATATSLAAIGITALSGVTNYAFHGDVDVTYAALVGVPAAFGAIGGGTLQQRLRTVTVERLFALVLLGTAVWLFVK